MPPLVAARDPSRPWFVLFVDVLLFLRLEQRDGGGYYALTRLTLRLGLRVVALYGLLNGYRSRATTTLVVLITYLVGAIRDVQGVLFLGATTVVYRLRLITYRFRLSFTTYKQGFSAIVRGSRRRLARTSMVAIRRMGVLVHTTYGPRLLFDAGLPTTTRYIVRGVIGVRQYLFGQGVHVLRA